VRRGLILSGSLCLIGLIGPFADAIGWRTIGILGYTVVFGLTCLPLSRTFKVDTSRADPRRSLTVTAMTSPKQGKRRQLRH
jgi:hypothetical protein